jgi:hypothetical protein
MQQNEAYNSSLPLLIPTLFCMGSIVAIGFLIFVPLEKIDRLILGWLDGL